MTELGFWLGKGSSGDVDFIHGHLIFFLFIPHQDLNHPFENIFFLESSLCMKDFPSLEWEGVMIA